MMFDPIDEIVDGASGRTLRQPKHAKRGRLDRVSDHTEDDFRPRIVTRCLADVEPVEVTWLWPDRIPRGKLCLIIGDPGVGKSFAMLDVAARLSRGTSWPDRPNEAVTPGNTVILSAEDDAADTIRPRLDAAGADPSRIFFVDGVQRSPEGEPRYFSFDTDLHALEQCIARVDAQLVIVDPISAYLDGRDSHSNAEIRGLLGPLGEMAARHGCAIVAVNHLNKGGGGKAVYRSMGSLAFPAAARIAWLVAKDADDPARRLVLPVKSNLIRDPHGIAFHIDDGRVCWHVEPMYLSGGPHLDVAVILGS